LEKNVPPNIASKSSLALVSVTNPYNLISGIPFARYPSPSDVRVITLLAWKTE
jgi:hypothetical protein